ncbi:MAG: D-aminoacyl-tRNA deacylase [Bacteroidales bacterium]
MRAVIQRVTQASLTIDSHPGPEMKGGLVVLLGIEEEDGPDDIHWLSGKICRLRVFDDADGVMNRSVQDIGGEVMIVSQFTLHASTKKGNRPSYIRAAAPEVAIPVYEAFLSRIRTDLGRPVLHGTFGAHMEVRLLNDGPVTLWIDTKNKE